tara:strand:+ start:1118 stop:1318 length:201 start_codon:yes stop_codon:yes gene_type:complete
MLPVTLFTSAIDTQIDLLSQANEIVKKNTVKELHTYMDNGVNILTQTAEYAKEIIKTNSKVFAHSK